MIHVMIRLQSDGVSYIGRVCRTVCMWKKTEKDNNRRKFKWLDIGSIYS